MSGRPTTYSDEMLAKTSEYIDSCNDETSDKGKVTVNLPSIEGLAYFLKVNKDTLYEWCKVHPEYSDVIDDLRAKQARALLNNGLAGTYNPTIAKVLLTKHGYREGIDNTTNDKDLPTPIYGGKSRETGE